ncbi:MAG: long-chain fatty acid--CoA ligase [Ignavibacteriaceae bacterium]
METPVLTKNRLIDILPYQLEHYPNEKAFSDKITGIWRSFSTAEVKKIIDDLSLGFLKLGCKPGVKIAIISNNRVEWNFIDIAVLQIGGVVVPLYPTTSEDNYAFIFEDAKVKIAFAETGDLFKKVQKVNKKLKTKLEAIYTFDKVESAPIWNDVQKLADEIYRKQLDEISEKVEQHDLATIIYTSGTTGIPKGVMLSHRNIMGNVNSLAQSMPISKFKRTISFLPLCHIFERTAAYFYMLLGTSINYPESMEKLGDNIKEVKPHYFITVPRLLEKIFEKIMSTGYNLSIVKRAIFGWSVNLGLHYHDRGRNNWFYNLRLFIARKLVFVKWVEALGGEIKGIISGSAALQPRLSRVFTAAGIPVIEGYGLTETSPVLTCNRFDKGGNYFGTVGYAIPDVEIKIAENGEILGKGPNLMMGYYNHPEATKKAIDEEGWFHTGDVGEILDGKYLKITGRLKEIFKTSGGKFIIPQPIENKMKESFFIEHIMVIGENRKYTAAIIQPSFDFVRKWAKGKNIELITRENIAYSKDVKDRIWEEVEKYNKRFGHVQQVKKILLVPDLWSIETGELTPTLKAKRDVICKKYMDLIDQLYSEETNKKADDQKNK